MNLINWAIRHGVSAAALDDLRTSLGMVHDMNYGKTVGVSETAVQQAIRAEAPAYQARLWRNNSGAGMLEGGSFVRWGLCNESAAMNARIKSADLIGIRKILIGPQHVGQTIGQFTARECKPAGWVFTGADREQAQLAFLGLVTSYGGDARFATGSGTL